jgi:hypothetical protein
MRGITSVLTVAAVALALPAPSQAQTPTPAGTDCEFMAALTSFNPDAFACEGAFVGNDMHYQDFIKNLMVSQWGFTNPEFLGKSDDEGGNGPFTGNPGGGTGTLTFDVPRSGDYVLVLKSGNAGGEGGFSIYFFNDTPLHSSVYYTVIGTSANCQTKKGVTTCSPRGLSHASLYGGRTVSVPEPQSAALLLTGLTGLGFVAGRRRKENAA